MNSNNFNDDSRVPVASITCLFVLINLPALTTLSGPSWTTQNRISLEAIFIISLLLINAAIIYAVAAFSFHIPKISKQTLKKFIPGLVLILETLLFGVSSMMAQLMSPHYHNHWILVYQTAITTIAMLMVGLPLIGILRNLTKDAAWSFREQIMMLLLSFPAIMLTLMPIYSWQSELSEETKIWSEVSSTVIWIAFVLFALYLNLNRNTFLWSICDETYRIMYLSAALISLYRGIHLIRNRCEKLYHQNQSLELLLILSHLWVIIWTIVPSLLDGVTGFADYLLGDILKFSSFFCDNENQAQNLISNQEEDAYDDGFVAEALKEGLREIGIEEARENGCSVCWTEFVKGEKIISRNSCNHSFHKTCLDSWIKRDARCPLCRGHIRFNEMLF